MDDSQKSKDQLLAEVQALREALQRNNADLEQFAYVASHDLKAPLRGISNLAQWLEEDLEPQLGGESRRQFGLLRGRVQRLETLLDGLLEYSRATRGHHAPEPVDVGALIQALMAQLTAGSPARLDLGPGMPILTTERLPLQKVLMHLLSNAAKHARRDDLQVRVEVAEVQGVPQFRVTDNGQGIAPQHHEKIWSPFQTLVARDKVEGAGMGLCVVKKIVESRGGQVGVASELGTGATFHFTWPAARRQ
ncbi:sensor histidine kinase [Myxococcus qinghaiensis]|uniref:sensor histidine kinase n=1 Tax=Myxococcus qinghaiensis TaxID=2906758 RepID=UPI0020A7FB52|nr:ATP-binding protein [Myxococcus qinghaiensis]MCP3167784.1 ATP-binding protein [Myxococcus qinghaiensis]